MSEITRQETIVVGTPATSPSPDEYVQLIGPSGSRFIKATDIDDFDPTNTELTGTTSIEKVSISGPITEPLVMQSAHGFSNGEALRLASGIWVKAIANDYAASFVDCIASEVTANTFRPIRAGKIAGSFVAGPYYLSDATAGQLTQVQPTDTTSFRVQVIRAISTTEAYVEIGEPLTLKKIPWTSVDFIETNPAASPISGRVLDHPTLLAILDAILDNNSPTESYTAVTVTGDAVDGNLATKGPFVKTIAADWEPTFTNFVGGREYEIEITNTDEWGVTWPEDVVWENDEEPALSSGSVSDLFGFRLRGGKYRGRRIGKAWPVDTIPPTIASAVITTVDNVEYLTITLSENGRVGTAGSGGFTTSTGALGALVSHSGAVFVYPFTGRIASSATVTLSYTQPVNGIQDMMRNDLASVTGVSVTNSSTYNPISYVFAYDFNSGTGTPEGITVIGSANFAYTTVAIEGERSAAVSTSNTGFYISFPEMPILCTHGMFRIAAADLPAAVVTLVGIRGPADQALCSLRINGSVLTLFANGLDSGPSSFPIAVNTTYYFWLEYTVNGTAYLWVSTSPTKPANTDSSSSAYLSRGVGTAGLNAARLRFGKGNTTGTYIVDKLRGSATPIGNSP